MNREVKVLTILGSPHDAKSNTRCVVEDFLDEVEDAGLAVRRTCISLGKKQVLPCRGCWTCTYGKPCPIDDDLQEIKAAMVDCDMLILASPVYTNQVTAQMKALFDRLFTWCHIFPLLGTYGLSVCTTGNDGQHIVADYLEKILATYGASSFGSLIGTRAYTSGFFPGREAVHERYKKLASRVAVTINAGSDVPVNSWQRKMFKTMKRKMTGVHVLNYIHNGSSIERPDPPAMMVCMVEKLMTKRGVTEEQIERLSRLMEFELGWWSGRQWLKVKSYKQLASAPIPEGFDSRAYLLETELVK